MVVKGCCKLSRGAKLKIHMVLQCVVLVQVQGTFVSQAVESCIQYDVCSSLQNNHIQYQFPSDSRWDNIALQL